MSRKSDLQELLSSASVEGWNNRTSVVDLEKLANANDLLEDSNEGEVAGVAPADDQNDAPVNRGDSVDVLVAEGGAVIRTYNLEDHGENYAKLAAEFAGKVPGRVVV